MRRSTLALVLSMTAVFVSGVVVGGFGYRLCTSPAVVEQPEQPAETTARQRNQDRRPTPEEYRTRFVSFYTERFQLTDDQVDQLQAILNHTEDRVHELDAKTRPERSAIQRMQTEEIRGIMTPEQLPLYEQFLADRADRRARRDSNRRNGRGDQQNQQQPAAQPAQ